MKKAVTLTLIVALLFSAIAGTRIVKKVRADTVTVPDDYSTIQDAINAANEGDTIFIRNGNYEGQINQTLVISKTLTLMGENVNNTIIKLYPAYNVSWILTTAFFSYSNAIAINANDVRLSNLNIVIAAPGGYIAAIGDMIQITGNNITTGSETGLVVNGSYCNITENTSGGLISLNGSSNIIARNSFSKIYISGNSNTVRDNTCWNLRLSNANQNVVSENKIGTTTRHSMGIYVVGNSSHNVFDANTIAGYSYDVEINSDSAENNTFYHNNFINNYNNHVYMYMGNLTEVINFWYNGEEGNCWEDYNGTDANRDGIGDTPYVIDGDNIDNYPLMFPYDVENNTVALPPEPFPIPLAVAVVIVVADIVVVAAVSVGLSKYLKKRK